MIISFNFDQGLFPYCKDGTERQTDKIREAKDDWIRQLTTPKDPFWFHAENLEPLSPTRPRINVKIFQFVDREGSRPSGANFKQHD